MTRLHVLICSLVLGACGVQREAPDAANELGELDAGSSPLDAGFDAGATDAGGMRGDAGVPFDAGFEVCEASNPALCEYPSLGLSFTVVRGVTVQEPVTGRELPLLVRFPDRSGPLPVVVWSHGGSLAIGNEEASVEWGSTFARHGYIDVHVGHIPLTAAGSAGLCAQLGLAGGSCAPSADEDANGLLAVVRANDLAAVLEALPRVSMTAASQGRPTLDLTRVALAGWSGGSRGPALNVGAMVTPISTAGPFGVPHLLPVAAILASPTGPGFGGFYELPSSHSWAGVRTPTLMLTGENDVKPTSPGLNGPVRRRPFDLVPGSGHHWLLYSELAEGVGGHGTYNLGDRASTDPRLDGLTRALQSAARAFLDAELMRDPRARAWLESSRVRVLAGAAQWRNR